MSFVPKDEAYGVYKGPLYPQLQDEEARLCRYAGEWVAARFLTEGVSINPTGESFHVDPSTCWILLHADDFDIIRGELGPCDWCSSFDFRCTNACKDKVTRLESRRDGSIIMPAVDPLRELAKLIGHGDPFAPYRPRDDFADTMVAERVQPDEYLREQVRFHAGGYVDKLNRGEAPFTPRPYQYTTRLVMIIAVCWFITGVCLGWWGTYTWPWW